MTSGRGFPGGIEWLQETMAFIIACIEEVGFIHFSCEHIELKCG